MLQLIVSTLAFQAGLRLPRGHAARAPAVAAVEMPWESNDEPDVKALISKSDITVGSGDAAAKGKTITFDFESKIVDGDALDSAQGVSFELGKVDIIPGWLDGLTGMQSGGVRKVVLPEELWKSAQPNVIAKVPKGVGAKIEFTFTMKDVKSKSALETIGIAPTRQNAILGGLILLTGLIQGVQALNGGDSGDGDSMF